MRIRLTTTMMLAILALTTVPMGSAAASNCLAEVIAAEKAAYGTAWGRDAVANLARDPGQFEGASSLGEVASSLARTSLDTCPVPEG